MLVGVFRRTDEQVLDVVVGAAEAEVGVGREEGLVGCLGELANWVKEKVRCESEDEIGDGRTLRGGTPARGVEDGVLVRCA